MKLIDGNEIQLPAHSHFDNPKNCTKEIMQQFESDYYAPFISSGDKVFLDIGANIGLFALHVLPYADKIICMEPTPSHFELLQLLTGRYPQIKRINKALSSSERDVSFYLNSENTTTNSLVAGEQKITVSACTLSQLIKEYGVIDFCKIDIEGSEIIALSEMEILAASKRVKKIFIEFHEVKGMDYEEIRSLYIPLFQKWGYETTTYNADCLFCKKDL